MKTFHALKWKHRASEHGVKWEDFDDDILVRSWAPTHPYPTRIGIKTEVQHFFVPFIKGRYRWRPVIWLWDGLEHLSGLFTGFRFLLISGWLETAIWVRPPGSDCKRFHVSDAVSLAIEQNPFPCLTQTGFCFCSPVLEFILHRKWPQAELQPSDRYMARFARQDHRPERTVAVLRAEPRKF